MNDENPVKTCPKCKAEIPTDAPGGLCPKCLLEFVAMSTSGGSFSESDRLPPSIDSLRAAFPQWELLELIGHGGMGAVYKMRQPKLDRFVALKVLPLRLANEPSFAERFEREARLLARLNHPNIVGVYDFGQADGHYYLVMEYVDGVNLRQALRTGGFTAQQALSVIPKICEALQFAHDEGILHRDIKPENILLDTKGRVKIADFGIAKFTNGDSTHGITATGARIGTPHYMAPEQIEQPASVDHRADIFSLGVVFYEMLTGELPLGRFAAPSERSNADARLDDVVMRALEKDRERRQQSANEVRTQVELLVNNATRATAPVTQAQTPQAISHQDQRKVKRHPFRPTLALLFLIGSILLPFILAMQQRGPSNTLFELMGLIATWFAIPAMVIGAIHLLYLVRSGERHGIWRSLLAVAAWPMVIVIWWSLKFAMALFLYRYSVMAELACVVVLIAGTLISIWGVWRIKRSIAQIPPDPRFLASQSTQGGQSVSQILQPILLIMWCMVGTVPLLYSIRQFTLRQSQIIAQSTQRQLANQILNEPEVAMDFIEDVTTSENVLIINLKLPAGESQDYLMQYFGHNLLPKAQVLATDSYQSAFYFPNEGQVKISVSPEANSKLTLAFAMPDVDSALACKNKILRTRSKPESERNVAFNVLFQIDTGTWGVYEATFVTAPSHPMASQYGFK